MTLNETKELEVQQAINRHVDAFKSFRFNAGAGAGKTYALIETLKYVTVNKIARTKSSRKVVCITYTNVAVSEIESRLGNSETVYVSTIHERIWDIIQKYQPKLLMLHKEKIEHVIKENNKELYTSDKAIFFANLDTLSQQEFFQFVMQTKDIFYQSKNLKAAPFKNAYKNITEVCKPEFLDDCLKNVGKFKYTVGLLYKNQKLEECLARIYSGKENRVDYDSRVNTDRLYYMKFSHDTLLEYGFKLIVTYPILCRIIIDSYPYFFIDEYQDTHSDVVKFVKAIHDYALESSKDWMVGYFGDTAQSIYGDGVGRRITDIHDNLVDIDNLFNRRSHKQIIDVANKIRTDSIVQKPIFNERANGKVHFSYNESADKITISQQFLDEYKNDILAENRHSKDVDLDNKIHCLVLTNKLVASFNGFDKVYEVFQKSVIYYDNLNTQVLSQHLEKLHPTVLTIYRLVKLYQNIHHGIASYYDIFGGLSTNLPFSKASLVIQELKNVEVESFKDWVESIVDLLENSGSTETLTKALINCLNYEQNNLATGNALKSLLIDNINSLMNEDSSDEDSAKQKIDDVLSLPLLSLINWAKFIDGIEADDIIYHTYHGTKGEEYQNVAIILEHSFGSKYKNKFKSYFEIEQESKKEKERLLTDSEIQEKHINTRNLLYVACSRAIKNLRVLYLDDISEIETGINYIFGECKPWSIGRDYSSE